MKKPKLSADQVAPYLPYKVKAKFQYNNDPKCRTYVIGTVGVLYDNGSICCFDTVNASPDRFRLILNPKSYATNSFAKAIGLNDADQIRLAGWLCGYHKTKQLPYYLFQKLVENHIDVFDLIPKRLAIAI
jgi:hypothetical protein